MRGETPPSQVFSWYYLIIIVSDQRKKVLFIKTYCSPVPRDEIPCHQGARDALLPVFLALTGQLFLTLFTTRVVVLDYLSHGWFLAIVIFWVLVVHRRFPIGRLTRPSLRGWFGPWIVVGGLNVLIALQGSRLAIHHAVVAWLIFEGLVVGPVEELLFRGLIQTTLNNVIAGASLFGKVRWGTIVATLIFGCVHFANLSHQSLDVTIQQVIFATITGLVLGHYYDRTQNLWGAALLHNFIDVTSIGIPLLFVR